MSLLNFLRIAGAGNDRPRPRRLAVESLEHRAVMAVVDPLLGAVAEVVVPPPAEVLTPVAEPVETLTEPITGDPPPLPEDPVFEDPLPIDPPPDGGDGEGEEEEIAPEIADAGYSRLGLWVTFTGFVQDDGPVEGLTVYFSTDLGQQFSTTVAADGSFNSMQVLIGIGAQVSIWTIDADGNYSEYCLLIV